MQGDQAAKLVQYMRDGEFLDSATERVTVEAVTFNAQHNVFAVFRFLFDWQARTRDPPDQARRKILLFGMPLGVYPSRLSAKHWQAMKACLQLLRYLDPFGSQTTGRESGICF